MACIHTVSFTHTHTVSFTRTQARPYDAKFPDAHEEQTLEANGRKTSNHNACSYQDETNDHATETQWNDTTARVGFMVETRSMCDGAMQSQPPIPCDNYVRGMVKRRVHNTQFVQ